MSYTIVSAAYANVDHTAAILMTQEAGAVLASEVDTPERWSELLDSGIVVAPYAASVPALDDYRRAIQDHVDATAQAHSYDSGITCSSYIGSTNPVWAAEAQAFVAWRDAVWIYAFAELEKVQNGQRPQPTIPEIISELPSIVWP